MLSEAKKKQKKKEFEEERREEGEREEDDTSKCKSSIVQAIAFHLHWISALIPTV